MYHKRKEKEKMIKLNRGKLVRKYIGEAMAPFGFEYKGYKGDSWVFERKQKNVVQTIGICPYRFEPSWITFELYTTARGCMGKQASDIEGVDWQLDLTGYWQYRNEEEFIEVLQQMKELLIKKGLKMLYEMSIEEEETDTDEMYHELYYHHDELCEQFIEKTGIKATGYDEENINHWFEVIEERVAVLKQGNWEDAKEELIEMAAFLGNQLVKYMGGEWYHFKTEYYESCAIQNCKCKNMCGGSNCLRDLVGGYTKNGMEWVKQIYIKIYRHRS